LVELKRCFDLLRKKPIWKHFIKGGFTVTEITYNRKHGWHPHYHILAYANWFDFDAFCNQWQVILKRQYGRGVRPEISRIEDPTSKLHYVTKYLTKLDFPEEHTSYVSGCLKGRNFFNVFGCFKGQMKLVRKAEDCCTGCGGIGRLTYFQIEYHEMPKIRMMIRNKEAPDYSGIPPPVRDFWNNAVVAIIRDVEAARQRKLKKASINSIAA